MNTPEKKLIKTNKTATYYTLGDYSNASSVYFVLHGYGMLAEFFIKKFQCLNDFSDNYFIIAPEALSRFYLAGYDGRVGASWMTKSSREEEIEDYINYLDLLYEKYALKNNLTVNLLGFSQGTATLSRWFCNGKVNPDNLIYWAGAFSIDMKYELLANTSLQIFVSREDEYVPVEKLTDSLKKIDELTIPYDLVVFKGGHAIPKEVLLDSLEKYNW